MRTQSFLKATALAVLLFPFAASAQVVISEIMYDLQTGSDSGREWIEVFNVGSSPVHITDWKVAEGGSNHGIASSQGGENLPSGAYAILADNPTKFLEDWPAYSGILFDTAFTSGLSNSGETIAVGTLNSGTFVPSDSVSYQSSWGAAGDGNSLLRTNVSSATFSAGAPTPGTGSLSVSSDGSSDTNSNTDTNATTTDSTGSPQATANTSAPVSSYVAPPEPQIFADAGDNRTVIVAADTEFLGRAYNRKKETVSSRIRFLWNFGDGAVAEGESVLHHFEYPGRYAVVLNIAENRDAASDRIIVTAEPAKLTLTAFSDGSIMIDNNAGRDLDLSRWIVRSLGRSFVLPQDSIILAGEALRMGEKTLGFRSSPETELDYPNGAFALQSGTTSAGTTPEEPNPPAITPPASQTPVQNASTEALPAPLSETAGDQAAGVSMPEAENTVIDIDDAPASSSQAAVAAAASGSDSAYLWWLGVFGLAVAGGGALVAARHVKRREWDIVE